MSDPAKRTVADVVSDFWVWFVANGHTLLGSQVQAELVSRINYYVETEIARREAMIRFDEHKMFHHERCSDGNPCTRRKYLQRELARVERP